MRIPGRVSPAKAARLLHVHYNTIYRCCRATLAGKTRAVRSLPAPLVDVSQDPVSGYITVGLHEVHTLRALRSTGGRVG